jgi:cell division protein FtsQ
LPSGAKPWRAALYGLAGAAIVVGVGWALVGDRLLVVRSIKVTGTHLVTQAQVLAAADVPLGTPLLRVNPGAVTRRVETITDVASATVTDDWPDGLTIAITERVPVMAVKLAGGGYDQVDATGVIVQYTQAKPTLPLLVTPLSGSALRRAPSVAAAATVLAQLQRSLASQVASVSAAPVADGPEQVSLSLRDGTTVKWGSPGDAAQKNRELAVLQSSRPSVIDVSAPGTVVTR